MYAILVVAVREGNRLESARFLSGRLLFFERRSQAFREYGAKMSCRALSNDAAGLLGEGS